MPCRNDVLRISSSVQLTYLDLLCHGRLTRPLYSVDSYHEQLIRLFCCRTRVTSRRGSRRHDRGPISATWPPSAGYTRTATIAARRGLHWVIACLLCVIWTHCKNTRLSTDILRRVFHIITEPPQHIRIDIRIFLQCSFVQGSAGHGLHVVINCSAYVTLPSSVTGKLIISLRDEL